MLLCTRGSLRCKPDQGMIIQVISDIELKFVSMQGLVRLGLG